MTTPAPVPYTQEYIKKRKMAVFLPVLVVPFCTVMFTLFGGGKEVQAEVATTQPTGGFNMELPGAGKTKDFKNKLEAYSAPMDSTNRTGLGVVTSPLDTLPKNGANYTVAPNSQAFQPGEDPAVVAVREKMASIQAQNAAPAPQPAAPAYAAAPGSGPAGSDMVRSAQQDELDRSLRELEDLKREYQRRLNGDPAASAPVAKAAPVKKAAPTVVAPASERVVSSLGGSGSASVAKGTKKGRKGQAVAAASQGPAQSGGFHTVGGNNMVSTGNTLPAVIHSDQTVVDGSTVKMRLTEAAQINGKTIPANTYVYGVCHMNGERLTITIESMQYENSIIPVKLDAYDLDGAQGLYIPGAIMRDASKQGVQQGISTADALTMSGNAGAAAAGVAMQTGKNLISRKARMVRVNLKANYQILLK